MADVAHKNSNKSKKQTFGTIEIDISKDKNRSTGQKTRLFSISCAFKQKNQFIMFLLFSFVFFRRTTLRRTTRTFALFPSSAPYFTLFVHCLFSWHSGVGGREPPKMHVSAHWGHFAPAAYKCFFFFSFCPIRFRLCGPGPPQQPSPEDAIDDFGFLPSPHPKLSHGRL